MSRTIYCISGLGADERIFSRLLINNYELKFVSWIRPLKKESISSYAQRMMSHIPEEDAFLLGVSFGGMMSIEIARHKNLKKVIIVSSIKSRRELPAWMRAVGRSGFNKLIPMRPYGFIQRVGDSRLGVSNEEERKMVRDYRNAADPVYLDWAVDQVLNWQNEWVPGNLVHIHGEADRIFPIKKVNATYVIPGGTHMMVYNRAKEVAEYIQKEIELG